ncbi:uncharacterized protein LOC135704046 isoform X2 [Ochlerotatus camptorhynchus]|uniref:uncharacterized protein LOC135704046 isoform X2 n=1 Tax=Ochlerotatus camptorhynchus TaxID=644619 RepID=UPI0031DDA2F5
MESESASVVAGSSMVEPKVEAIGDTGEDVASEEKPAIPLAPFRNVNTQHGDYRSVDEENIVVLRVCHSPEPKPVLVDGKEQPFIWIEEFVWPGDENEVGVTP